MLSFRTVKYRNDFFQYPCFKLVQRFKYHSCLSFQEQPLYYKNSAIPDSTIVKIAFFIIIAGGNLAASNIRNLECPSYEVYLIDYGCGKFNKKVHIME